MVRLGTWLLSGLLLLLWGSRLDASERGDYQAATRLFNLTAGVTNAQTWDRVEAEFSQFVDHYPKSENFAEAILRQAQARYNGGHFANAAELLTGHLAIAGWLADQYVYWAAESQFKLSNYTAAAKSFGQLARDYPASPLRLEASVSEGAAQAAMTNWPEVASLLTNRLGVFQLTSSENPTNEFIARGRTLTGEALFHLHDFAAAEFWLQPAAAFGLQPELDWQRQYLLSKVELVFGGFTNALSGVSNLLAIAQRAGKSQLIAESIAFHASLYEDAGRLPEAVGLYQSNLSTNTPPEKQRQALLKITQLSLVQGQTAEAIGMIERFRSQFSNSPAMDIALLTLGELHLKRFVATNLDSLPLVTGFSTNSTNELQRALNFLDGMVGTFTNSTHLGKAQLDRGWALWLGNRIPESAGAFRAATSLLPAGNPVSEDQAVAHLKLGEALFMQGDYLNALENDRAVVEACAQSPALSAALGDRASYQMIQAAVRLHDLKGAAAAMKQFITSRPHDPRAERTVLLVGQGFADLHEPAAERQTYEDFLILCPDSVYRPQVELAIARTHEQENHWPEAIRTYDDWLVKFPTNSLRAAAEFQAAMANYHGGQETNTLARLTSFIASYPSNVLVPSARMWIGDYRYARGDWSAAERNYKDIYQNGFDSITAYEACLMAGRAALGYADYTNAMSYFTNLTLRADCPPGITAKALFALGSTKMLLGSADTNRPFANYIEAISVFTRICEKFPTNDACPRAWAEIGKCHLAMSDQDPTHYADAIKSFQLAASSPYADLSVRSQAQIGVADTLKAQASTLIEGAEARTLLLNRALGEYLNVYLEKNRNPGEASDAACVAQAGVGAANTADQLGDFQYAINICNDLIQRVPVLKTALEKRKMRFMEHSAAKAAAK